MKIQVPKSNKNLDNNWHKALHNSHHLLGSIIFGVLECSKHPVHPDSVVAIIMAICGMVDSVITSTHYRPNLTMDAVMDICCPYRL